MKKWQNLVEGKCPDCGEFLRKEKDKIVLVECTRCDFFIGEKKMKQILADRNHKMRRHLTSEQKKLINGFSL